MCFAFLSWPKRELASDSSPALLFPSTVRALLSMTCVQVISMGTVALSRFKPSFRLEWFLVVVVLEVNHPIDVFLIL